MQSDLIPKDSQSLVVTPEPIRLVLTEGLGNNLSLSCHRLRILRKLTRSLTNIFLFERKLIIMGPHSSVHLRPSLLNLKRRRHGSVIQKPSLLISPILLN